MESAWAESLPSDAHGFIFRHSVEEWAWELMLPAHGFAVGFCSGSRSFGARAVAKDIEDVASHRHGCRTATMDSRSERHGVDLRLPEDCSKMHRCCEGQRSNNVDRHDIFTEG